MVDPFHIRFPSYCGVALILLTAMPAMALEPGVHPPFLTGVTNGIDLGNLPPPGFYVSDTSGHLTQELRGNNSQDLPTTQDVWLSAPSVQYVWDGSTWGARFSSLLVLPVASNHRVVSGRSTNRTGLVNTIITPLNLFWSIADGLGVSANMTFYPADGQYRRGSPVNIGNNFWSFEPNAAVTYESQDFVLTLHAIYHINMANTDSPYSRNGRYASGNEAVADYTGAVKLACG